MFHTQSDVDRAARDVLERCDALAAFSEEPDRLTRRFATPALREASGAVERWMREAGMATRRDAIGNVVGRLEPAVAGERTLFLGSHIDTVRGAGRYDGVLGVLVAIACVQHLRRALPFAVEVLAFADEEGVRYGTAYLGSAAVAGRFPPEWLERRDADGVTMADAIRAFGGDPGALASARATDPAPIGYCEVHIEQGPVLEAEDLRVGVVSGIAGQTRARVTFAGVAGHAGTVPMELRRDALTAAAEWILGVEGVAREAEGLVATVGQLDVDPGQPNVIPGTVRLSVDVRHGEDTAREAACTTLRERARAVAAARGVAVDWAPVQETPAVACSPALTEAWAAACEEAGQPVRRLAGGAGHDAAMMAGIAPVAMLFVRCAGGISHNPAESVDAADVAAAIDVTTRFLERLAQWT